MGNDSNPDSAWIFAETAICQCPVTGRLESIAVPFRAPRACRLFLPAALWVAVELKSLVRSRHGSKMGCGFGGSSRSSKSSRKARSRRSRRRRRRRSSSGSSRYHLCEWFLQSFSVLWLVVSLSRLPFCIHDVGCQSWLWFECIGLCLRLLKGMIKEYCRVCSLSLSHEQCSTFF